MFSERQIGEALFGEVIERNATSTESGAYRLDRGDPELAHMLGGDAEVTAGVQVTESSALSLSAVFAAVRNIAEDVAKLPLGIYQRLERGRRLLTDHPLDDLLNVEPNWEMCAIDARVAITACAVLWGRGIAEIEPDHAGRPAALWPIEPWRAGIIRDPYTRALTYQIDGHAVDPATLLHIKGFTLDGVVGQMVARLGRQGLGVAMAAEQLAASFFGNGSHVGGWLQHPGRLSPEAKRNLRASMESRHRGPGRAHRLGILEEGMTFSKDVLSPEESQFLETRQFQVEEVARWFRMPPHKLQQLLRATFSNIEHQSIEYVTDCLLPWMVRWEQELKRKALRDEPGVYAKHVVAGIMRGDLKARYDAYGVAIQQGFMSRNEVRELEELNPAEGLDVYLTPVNMQAATAVETEPRSARQRPATAEPQ